MSTYKMVASTSEVTVLAEYVPQYSAGGKSYQSEVDAWVDSGKSAEID